MIPETSEVPDEVQRPWAVMKEVVAYDAQGGIVESARMQALLLDGYSQRHGGRIVEGVAAAHRQFVQDGEIRMRPANPARLDGMTLRDLPVPCTLTIDGETYECDDPVAELEFSMPGAYVVTVRAWPHLDKEIHVENPAQA